MDSLDREIERLQRRLEHLQNLRDKRDSRIYQSDRWSDRPYDRYDSGDRSQEVSYFPLILVGLIFALLLI